MAFPLLPFAVGIAVGALAATRLRGTRTGAAIHRRACRLYGEAADRLSVALSREGRLVREYFPEPPADPAGDDAPAPPEGSRHPASNQVQ